MCVLFLVQHFSREARNYLDQSMKVHTLEIVLVAKVPVSVHSSKLSRAWLQETWCAAEKFLMSLLPSFLDLPERRMGHQGYW